MRARPLNSSKYVGARRALPLRNLLIFAVIIFSAFIARADSQCIQARHHYEGHPKPSVYVVTVNSVCDERRLVTVKIVDAIYGEQVHKEEFPLDPGDSRRVRIIFSGEKFFSYGVYSEPLD